MASGDTKTNQYLDIAANGTRADLPTDTCCETRTQSLIRGVAERVIGVEEEVERLENNPDVVDIVSTYQDLQNYDTSTLTDKDVIRVLTDSTHNNNSTFYRWNAATSQFDYIGEVTSGPTVVQTHGTSTTDVMSQNATSRLVFADPTQTLPSKIKIGGGTQLAFTNNRPTTIVGYYGKAYDGSSVAIGAYTEVNFGGVSIGDYAYSGQNAIAIGGSARATGAYSVGLGALSNPTEKGQVDISTSRSVNTLGYNNSQYRLLTGLYDPQNAHDAVTKGYVDGLVGDVSAALNAINNGTGA